MQIIDTKSITKNNIEIIKQKIADKNLKPKFAILLASNDEASKMYVELKSKKAREIGIESDLFVFDNSVTFEILEKTINDLNKNDDIDGILLQLPLFNHLKKYRNKILNLIDPQKDIDGLTYANLGKTLQSDPKAILPATVSAVMYCLKEKYDFIPFAVGNFDEKIEINDNLPNQLESKKVLIINNSILIGRPLSMILSQYNATVIIANKYTKNLSDLITTSEIIISATGIGHVVKSSMLSSGTLFIDVTSINKNGKVIGDLEIDDPKKDIFITSVPGGIGPLTISCLFGNLIQSMH